MAGEATQNQNQLQPRVVDGETIVRGIIAGGATFLGEQAGPEAMILAATASPLVEAVFTRTIQRMTGFAHQFGARAAAKENVDAEAFTKHLGRHPQAAALLADAGLAAARTDYEVKVEAIGQAIADGVLYEDGVLFDREAMLVRIICSMDRTGVSVLNQVVRTPRGVTAAIIEHQLPQLAGVTDKIIAELVATGLIRPRLDSPPESISSKIRRQSHRRGDVLEELARALDERTVASEIEQFETTATGVLVMERFLNAAVTIGIPLASDSKNLGDAGREYLGPVIPLGTSWNEGYSAIRGGPNLDQPRRDDTSYLFVHVQPTQRPGWVVTDQRCSTCSSRMIAEAVFTRYAGHDSETSASGTNNLCLNGCQ